LVRAAADCGLDAETTRQRLASDEDVETVTAQARRASEAGIDGVPCFIFDGRFAVSGAQSPEYLADALGRAVEQREATADVPTI
jgi:predicted DsbA family dithiol-disulfide isomerase